MDRERTITVTKEDSDVVETNQLNPRPLLTYFRSSRINLNPTQQYHLNEEIPAYDCLIQKGGVISYA